MRAFCSLLAIIAALSLSGIAEGEAGLGRSMGIFSVHLPVALRGGVDAAAHEETESVTSLGRGRDVM